MVATTYGVADSNTASKDKGVFAMMFESITDSQMKRSERELSRYTQVLPRAGEDTEEEPFGGW